MYTDTREVAVKAYNKIIDALYKYDSNPTYELCKPTIENLTSAVELYLMKAHKLIKFVGYNHNGIAVYQVRF